MMNLLNRLLPDSEALRIDHLETTASEIVLQVSSMQPTAACPLCHAMAEQVHSGYQRTLADLPWASYRVKLQLKVRKFYCRNERCPRRIFSERHPTIAAAWARRTDRLAQRLVALALAQGGAPGARLSEKLGMTASRNTLLRLIRRHPPPIIPIPRVLGVDDWARRKRHVYGTVLIDLERRHPTALLKDRESTTLAPWLKGHRGVEVIARDRAVAYADGATQGAPGAVQVADRFHLLGNIAEALQQVFAAHAKPIAALTRLEPPIAPISPPPIAPPSRSPSAQVRSAQRRANRLARYQAVWQRHRQGYKVQAIARDLGLNRLTVERYLAHPTFPERQGRPYPSLLDPFKAYLHQRWQAGCRNRMQLFREIKSQGFRGQRTIVKHYVGRLRKAEPAPMAPEPAPLTPNAAVWLVMRRPERRDRADRHLIARLKAQHPQLREAVELTEAFTRLVRKRRPHRLERWLKRALTSELAPLRRFARRLTQDITAVQAALTLPWSNGPTEGYINRLKLLKRSMYGRAGLDLLSQRFLLAA
jgi:transposase